MTAGLRPPAQVGRPLLIFPFNGNAIEAMDSLRDDARAPYRLVGFIDDTPGKQGVVAHGAEVGDRGLLARHPGAAVLAVHGSPLSYLRRRELIEGLDVDPARWATVIDPSARVSAAARVGRNVLICAGVVVSGEAVIGDHVCVLPNTVVHHHARIGDWCLVGSNVTVAGHAEIGANCYIGSGSSIINSIAIGARTLVGLGSCVVRDVGADRRVAGNPHRDLDLPRPQP